MNKEEEQRIRILISRQGGAEETIAYLLQILDECAIVLERGLALMPLEKLEQWDNSRGLLEIIDEINILRDNDIITYIRRQYTNKFCDFFVDIFVEYYKRLRAENMSPIKALEIVEKRATEKEKERVDKTASILFMRVKKNERKNHYYSIDNKLNYKHLSPCENR